MSHDLSDLTQSFVEDCREHLDSIEASLMDIEADGEHLNAELVNGVFRLAHSIKGGAGMLGFDNIKRLAHKLENVLHMVRSGELVPTHAVVDVLLKGFDRLTFLVDNIHESEGLSIEAQVAQLLAVASPAARPAPSRPGPARFGVGKGGTFNVDAESLLQASGGGNELYLLEFDLIHDIHGQGATPFEVLKVLMDTGRIVDCKLDFATVGDLDDFGNSIPFYVLYASILEPKYVGGLVKLPEARVRHMDQASLAHALSEPDQEDRRYGLVGLKRAGSAGTVSLPEQITPAALEDLRTALAAGLADCDAVRMDCAGLRRPDLMFFQLVLAARLDFERAGKVLAAATPLPLDIRDACLAQGFAPDGAGCLLPLAAPQG